jgi:hypothetical protein
MVRGLPKQSGASLSGIATGQPRLSLTVTAGVDASKLKKLVIGLPNGLGFAHKVGNLRAGITLKGRRGNRIKPASLKVTGGKLTITLGGGGAEQLRLAITTPALSASAGLTQKVQQHRAGKLKLALKVVDTSGQATAIAFRVKPS